MHNIEPFYSWRNLYIAAEDERSPFYGTQNSEVFFEHSIYDHYIHPQWDHFGSQTLYLKLLFVDYEKQYTIIELFGEWNDVLYNDIMFLYRNVVEELMDQGIQYFILIGDNILDFHADTDDYYAEWFDNLIDGWIVALNFRDHVREEFQMANIDHFLAFGGQFDKFAWRTLRPDQLFGLVNDQIMKRLT